ncbi:MAG: energy-coupling factor transporter transmembrane component T [Actinomycetota bacterium]
MRLHPATWIAWLTAVGVFAFSVTNPLYVVLALGAVLVVHLSFPPDRSAIGRAVRMFLTLGLALLVLRLVFVAMLPNPGRTVLFHVPAFDTPRWLGGLELGGGVTAEVLMGGASEGLRLIVVLAAFGVFNAHADVVSLIRTVPSAFRDVGLVVSVAVAFVPGMLRTVSDVRDAQRLRGEWGLRRLAPSLVVPVLGLSLERALLLAESMDVRGYGRGQPSLSARVLMWTGLGGVFVAVAVWVSGTPRTGGVLALIGCTLIVLGFRATSLASPVTRLQGRPIGAFDVAAIVAAVVALGVTLFASFEIAYDPYPVATWPPFSLPTAAVTMLFTVPALAATTSDARSAAVSGTSGST